MTSPHASTAACRGPPTPPAGWSSSRASASSSTTSRSTWRHRSRRWRPLGFQNLVPHAELAFAATEKAEDQLILERYPQVVSSLEVALTSYHELAVGLQPPEEAVGQAGA